jgi:sterol desaturase/sphingolipid hydroxylase (fatty acid hydroxylase superfamily)
MPKATPESPPMFESRLVDHFSRTHFSIVPILYVPGAAVLVWYSVARAGLSVGLVALWVVLGFVAWTFSEYWLHRTFFHWVPRGRLGERMHFLVHGVHHTWPRDKYRLVMPPAVSITLYVLFLGIFVLLFGKKHGPAVHAGYVLGYMYYDLMHYYLHHGRPRSSYLKELKRHHMVHHFKESSRRFGVSSRFWDYVFRTA